MRRFFRILVGVVLLGLSAAVASGAVINVLADYPTIQQGVDAATDGDTINVAAGTYAEAVYINKRVALVGDGTPTITAQGINNTNTITFNGTLTNGALISGLMM